MYVDPYTVHLAPYTVYVDPYTVFVDPYTVNVGPHTVYIVHLGFYTIYVDPYAVHLAPYTVYVDPYTVFVDPYTVNGAPVCHYRAPVCLYGPPVCLYAAQLTPFTASSGRCSLPLAPSVVRPVKGEEKTEEAEGSHRQFRRRRFVESSASVHVLCVFWGVGGGSVHMCVCVWGGEHQYPFTVYHFLLLHFGYEQLSPLLPLLSLTLRPSLLHTMQTSTTEMASMPPRIKVRTLYLMDFLLLDEVRCVYVCLSVSV
jgi:hypothetical protein